MRRPRARSRILKKLPGAPGADRKEARRRTGDDRDLVRRRGAHRPEEQDHAALGAARNTSIGPARPAHRFDLHLRCRSARSRARARPRPARLQHRGDEPAPRRNRRRRSRRARTPSSCSIRPAGTCRRRTRRPGQHDACPAAAEMPGTEPGRRTSGSSSATTGCRTASSNPTTTSSTTAATPGTSSSTSPGASCPSECAIGLIGSDQSGLGISGCVHVLYVCVMGICSAGGRAD